MNRLVHTACVLPLAIAASSYAQQFFDGTFLDSTWSASKLADTTPAQDALFSGLRGSGGNPGDCRTIAHNWQVVSAGVSIAIGHTWDSVTHNPSDLAGIQSIAFSFDARCDSAPIVNAIGFGPLLVQGDKKFAAAGFAAIDGAPWSTFSTTVQINDWDEIGSGDTKPDFSPGADPFVLGFYSSNGGSGVNARLTSSGRVDNFRVRFIRSCPTDLNGDGLVEDTDFTIFVASYNILDCADPAMTPGCPADFNFDDLVDDSDFTVFVGAYNELVCP
jgi:hypothetical protein